MTNVSQAVRTSNNFRLNFMTGQRFSSFASFAAKDFHLLI